MGITMEEKKLTENIVSLPKLAIKSTATHGTALFSWPLLLFNKRPTERS